MSKHQPPGGTPASRAVPAMSSAQLLDHLRRGLLARGLPLIADTLSAQEALLRRRLQADPSAEELEEDLTNLSILRRHATEHERRWQEQVSRAFDGWPQPAGKPLAVDAFSLVSDDQLQSQLVGQPVIEALERRFSDIIDVVDSRLWSLAASLGGQVRPSNPFAPRVLVEAFLHAYPVGECNPRLRQELLRGFERLMGDRFGDAYAWCNTQLADAGHAMVSGNDYALLMAGAAGGVGANAGQAKSDIWSNSNVLAPKDSTWREGKHAAPARNEASSPHDAVRGNALRDAARDRRRQPGDEDDQRRDLRLEEFLAVLSLLQGELKGQGADDSIAGALRSELQQGATRLGMDRDATRPSIRQDDAMDLVGQLFDGLVATHALSERATGLLARLAPPYLRLALSDPYLFDNADHPAMQLLSLLVQSWDANHADTPADKELHALADDVADDVIADYHGDDVVFAQALSRLQGALEPLRKRAEMAERRVWQSIQGRERLQGARRDADAHLRAVLDAQPLLPSVAAFLGDEWRQSLVQAWLRDGPDSTRYAESLAIGAAIAKVDRDAALAQGHAVANGLIALQQPLRDCYVVCGLDENGANALLARLVSELAQPDAPRAPREFTPLVDSAESESFDSPGSLPDAPDFAVGQLLGLRGADAPDQIVRLAWRSTLSGACLLVNRQGVRQALLGPREMKTMLGDGTLVARDARGPVESVLAAMVGDRR